MKPIRSDYLALIEAAFCILLLLGAMVAPVVAIHILGR
jgi:hypothetical protein